MQPKLILRKILPLCSWGLAASSSSVSWSLVPVDSFRLGAEGPGSSVPSVFSLDVPSRAAIILEYCTILSLNLSFMVATEGIVLEGTGVVGCCLGIVVVRYEGGGKGYL